MLDARLPEPLRGAVVGQLETNRAFELFELAGTDFDVEVVPLVGYLENFRPREPIDSEPVSVDKQASCTYS